MTLVIPVFNGAHTLPRVVEAVLAQHVERIVYVEDGSTDETARVLQSIRERDDRVHVETHRVNRGRAAARNTGARLASGDVVLFLDADIKPAPDWAETLTASLMSSGATVAVGSLAFGDLRDDDPYHVYLASTLRGVQRTDAGPISWRHFLAGACALRRPSFTSAGGFPEQVAYGEDLGLACRLASQPATTLAFEPAARATMYDPGTLGTALVKLRLFGEALPALQSDCPGVLELAGLAALAGESRWDRARLTVARGANPGNWIQRVLPRLPRALWPRAVRYLFAFTLADAAHDVLARSRSRP